MLEEGVYASVSKIGDAENISKSYVSRILRLDAKMQGQRACPWLRPGGSLG